MEIDEKRRKWLRSDATLSERCEGESCGRRCTRTFTRKTCYGVLCVTCFLVAEEAAHKREGNMHYCLSEEEYNKLIIEPTKVDDEYRDKLQRVCMLAANFVPVPPDNKPWGCYLDADGKPLKEMKGHFCDGVRFERSAHT